MNVAMTPVVHHSSFIVHRSQRRSLFIVRMECLVSAKRGLPERSVMRHDSHYVEELTRRSGRHIGTMLPLELIEPNSEQPRTQLGNIEELAASVREKGVLEPILVRLIEPNRYQIISGERRFRAASLAGLD